MPTFWVGDRIKAKTIELRFRCHMAATVNATRYAIWKATTSTRGKVLISKPKAPSFHTTKFSYINFFPYKIDQILGFWAGQSLKLRRNTFFRGFKVFFGVELQRTKAWKVGSLKTVNFNLLPFNRCPYDNSFWPIVLADFNITLGAWNGFSGNCRESCDRLFFLN